MDLTEQPEDIIFVLSLAFNSVNFAEVSLLRDALHHVLDKLWLGKRVLVVHGHMVKQLILGSARFVVLEDSELAHEVVIASVGVVADTLISVGQLLEETSGHLEGDIVSTIEDTSNERVAHPPLPHDSV